MTYMERPNRNDVFIVDETANPAPLGLCAFGMTTILLSLHNAGYIGLSASIIGMALFYGGIAQVIAGLLEWKKNNIFGFVTFGSFGFFWLTFAAISLLPSMGISVAPTAIDMAAFLFVWGLFVLGLLICSLRLHKLLLITLAFVLLMVISLIVGDVTGVELFKNLGGYSGIVAGFLALYMGMAQVINDVYQEPVLPV